VIYVAGADKVADKSPVKKKRGRPAKAKAGDVSLLYLPFQIVLKDWHVCVLSFLFN